MAVQGPFERERGRRDGVDWARHVSHIEVVRVAAAPLESCECAARAQREMAKALMDIDAPNFEDLEIVCWLFDYQATLPFLRGFRQGVIEVLAHT